ncbi:glycosyl transferase [Coprinopsis cinerea AmutBmut pab1-1]|nr:glycosyl transferase [Coprinopsis cinerea AmutBmut pab1-1]
MTQDNKPVPDPSFRFTDSQDWFSHNVESWKALLPIVTRNDPRILEIGSWEGRSAVFLSANLCKDGEIVCIDHFDLFNTDAGKERYERMQHNLGLTGKRFRILPEFSFPALMKLLEEEMGREDPGYDWIYVDGSHRADDTLLDGELAWRLARKGAVVIFDDYHWDATPEDSAEHPKRGIDAFLSLHRGEYDMLSRPENYQVVLKKTSEMRIGFLIPHSQPITATQVAAFGYSINIATATDSSYAMPASVLLATLVNHTPGRISIYVGDCGMTDQDRDMMERSLPKRDDVTMVFIPLGDETLARKWNGKWAKVDLLTKLPVERALYLDADILVRGDISELWRTDLGDKAIGAVIDVGYPMGCSGLPRREYFNSGVLLLDLAKVRPKLTATFDQLCEQFQKSDQDALNAHFGGDDWKSLSLQWNAQGLGTYASSYAPDRHLVDLAQMDNPAIVHFTGPLHPSLADVLNPWVQPCTAKPWGYAGSPGHPFAQEWFEALSETVWMPYYEDKWKQVCQQAKERAISKATEDFKVKVTLN